MLLLLLLLLSPTIIIGTIVSKDVLDNANKILISGTLINVIEFDQPTKINIKISDTTDGSEHQRIRYIYPLTGKYDTSVLTQFKQLGDENDGKTQVFELSLLTNSGPAIITTLISEAYIPCVAVAVASENSTHYYEVYPFSIALARHDSLNKNVVYQSVYEHRNKSVNYIDYITYANTSIDTYFIVGILAIVLFIGIMITTLLTSCNMKKNE